MIAKFQGTWAQRDSMYETVIYAHMKTFRFTGTPALYIECDIRMCHGSCPTQPCNWREGKHSSKVRRRRSLANITTVTDNEMESADVSVDEAESADTTNSSFSESLRLFQSLQVLANEEDREALSNQTESSERAMWTLSARSNLS